MTNTDLYERLREVPQEAQKTIGGGRLKGFTDINPMWRIKKLTEEFGACGVGWYYEITDKRIDEGVNGEKVATVEIALKVKVNNEWSAPIIGIGGSAFVAKEKAGLYTSDEAFKMALTDAISIACKALGMAADIYYAKDRSKYDVSAEASQKDQTIPADLMDKFLKLIKTLDISTDDICATYGINTFNDMKPEDFKREYNALVHKFKEQSA